MPPQKQKKSADGPVAPIFAARRTQEIRQDGGRTPPEDGGEDSAGIATLIPASKQDIAALFQKITEVQEILAGEIVRGSQVVKAEIQALGSRTSDLEARVEEVVQQANTSADVVNQLQDRVEGLEKAMEDASNRSRRNNLRLRGLSEEVSQAALEATVVGLFQRLLPDLPAESFLMDRVHRALRARGPPNSQPRDIILRLHYYKTKEKILRANRERCLHYEDVELQLFQDLAPITLARRRDWKPVTALLRAQGLKYTWGFPFRLIVTKDSRTFSCTNVSALPAFMDRLGLRMPDGVRSTLPPQLQRLPAEWQEVAD
uniref:Uncharacterized protein n=2 Tax=Leptobrachium leishanense TaxID=445787 RepID=A0A8C5PJA8_9ANUR